MKKTRRRNRKGKSKIAQWAKTTPAAKLSLPSNRLFVAAPLRSPVGETSLVELPKGRGRSSGRSFGWPEQIRTSGASESWPNSLPFLRNCVLPNSSCEIASERASWSASDSDRAWNVCSAGAALLLPGNELFSPMPAAGGRR